MHRRCLLLQSLLPQVCKPGFNFYDLVGGLVAGFKVQLQSFLGSVDGTACFLELRFVSLQCRLQRRYLLWRALIVL